MPISTGRLPMAFHENAGFLATNVGEESTGVHDSVVWIFAGEPTCGGSVLGPRLWVVAGAACSVESLSGAVVVTLSRPPEVFGALPPALERKALQFVEANRDVLVRYWRGRMDTQQMIDVLARV